jgi:hypothetical protein
VRRFGHAAQAWAFVPLQKLTGFLLHRRKGAIPINVRRPYCVRPHVACFLTAVGFSAQTTYAQ